MSGQFEAVFGPLQDSGVRGDVWENPSLLAAKGYLELSQRFSGASFANGLYRLHNSQSGPKALAWISEAYSNLPGTLVPFGFDWLGRQFALDSARVERGEQLVMMLEPGTGLALRIPTSFDEFHNQELIEFPDAALASEFFNEWLKRRTAPLSFDECAGYKVPLFLGGQDNVDNLELSNLDVYWSLSAQLISATRSLAPGAVIGGIA